ncbi:MAG: hypothetical protein GXO78_00460 [Calditrichaeota bacterium]|nr:hypothetical protein [Calditrichota bacterium]
MGTSRAQDSPALFIYYTANLNAALDDCQCGDENVGGLTRVATVLKHAREQHEPLLILDAGDFFNSYAQSLMHLYLLRMMARLPYTALNVGDQELVESLAFLQDAKKLFPERLPFLSTNLHLGKDPVPWLPMKKLSFPRIQVFLFALVDSRAFEFIAAEPVQVDAPEQRLRRWLKHPKSGHDFYLVLFHGTWQHARQLVQRFPEIDLIILGHNQQRRTEKVGQTLLVEPGTEGQWVGAIRVIPKEGTWQLEHRFIPVTREIAEDPRIKELALEFYRKLNQLQEGRNER